MVAIYAIEAAMNLYILFIKQFYSHVNFSLRIDWLI